MKLEEKIMSGTAMQIDKLDGENFTSWSVQMKSLLITLDYWHVIENVKAENLSAAEKVAWDRTDAKALATITLCVKPPELIHLKGCNTAKAAWEKLNLTYNGKGPARKVNLFKQLVKFQFKCGQKFTGQINEFCSIVDALNEIDVQIPDDLISILLLCSLPDEMENFVVAIESRDELPSINQLKAKILEDEHRRGDRGESSEQVFAVKNNDQRNITQENERRASRSSGKRGKKDLKCYGCGMRGHIKAHCKNKNSGQANAVVLSACNQLKRNNCNWILDSGASSHMCCEKNLFSSLNQRTQKVYMASGDNINAEGIGHVTLRSNNNINITLRNVLYVPQLSSNFLSVSKIIENGNSVRFADNKAFVNTKESKLIFVANLQDGIYSTKMMPDDEMVLSARQEDASIMWHRRFGHLNMGDLCKMTQKEMVRGMRLGITNDFSCVTCALCKICTKPFNEDNALFTSSVLDLIHTDICGPFRIPSQSGSVYFITFTDDFSRYMTTYFLKKKSDAPKVLKEFVASSEKQTGKKVKCIRSDNGREYVNCELNEFFKSKGIIHQRSVSYTPQQNGVAERANRTLVEMARCMLEESKLPQYLWSEAINTATYIRNRSPTKVLKDKTPHECWFGYKPSVKHMRAFGCDAIALIKQPGRSKLQPKGKILSFVGYANHIKGYRLYDKDHKTIIISRDVIFFEEKSTQYESDNKISSLDTMSTIFFDADNQKDRKTENASDIFTKNNIERVAQDSVSDVVQDAASNSVEVGTENALAEDVIESEQRLLVEQEPFVEDDNTESSGGRRINLRPRKVAAANTGRETANKLMTTVPDPVTVKEALQSDNALQWKKAMQEEYDSLVKNNTWDLVSKPKQKNIIGCKWVFTTKRNTDGEIEKYKARLVAQGCFQKHNMDYFETYAPVVRHPTIRLILALAVQNKLLVNHIDIAAAYLNAHLDEEVYMRQPDNFVDPNQPEKVCKIKKSLYGLKQAGRDWNKKINKVLSNIGFTRCKTDSCVYILRNRDEINIIGLYVDDLIIACASAATMHRVVENLNRNVEAIDRGPIKYYLGMQIERDGLRGNIKVHQKRYVEDLLLHWGMENCKPAFTPLACGTSLEKCTKHDCVATKIKDYQSLMGALNYLATISRPDISHAVSKLSQFNSHPHQEHFIAAKHILRYLRNDLEVCLTYKSNNELFCYTDADWGSDETDRKSYSGYIVYFGDGPVAWESKKQNVIALSTMEAEYIAMCQGAKEVVFQRSLLAEMGFLQQSKDGTTLYCDNQGASFFAKNDVTHKRSKHIDIKYHYLKDKCLQNEVSISYVSSNNNVADILTKCLNKSKHIDMLKKLFKN